MLRQIIYISGATRPFSNSDLQALCQRCQEYNAAQGITGLLIYSAGFFIHVLEGEYTAVGTLYQTICNDRRHAVMNRLVDCPIARRLYSNETLEFHHLQSNTRSDLHRIRSLIKQGGNHTPLSSRKLIKQLIELPECA